VYWVYRNSYYYVNASSQIPSFFQFALYETRLVDLYPITYIPCSSVAVTWLNVSTIYSDIGDCSVIARSIRLSWLNKINNAEQQGGVNINRIIAGNTPDRWYYTRYGVLSIHLRSLYVFAWHHRLIPSIKQFTIKLLHQARHGPKWSFIAIMPT
jgi:hypothetical protein